MGGWVCGEGVVRVASEYVHFLSSFSCLSSFVKSEDSSYRINTSALFNVFIFTLHWPKTIGMYWWFACMFY